MNVTNLHCQNSALIFLQSHLNQRVNHLTQNGFLNSYVFIYIGLIATLFLLYYLFQKKSSKFNVNTLKNLFEKTYIVLSNRPFNLKGQEIEEQVAFYIENHLKELGYQKSYVKAPQLKKLPDIINNRTYIILLNELARGDLKHLCKKKDFLKNNELLYNVFAQIILSILTFHNLGYIHRDCHWGNFLYHYNNNLTGYYH